MLHDNDIAGHQVGRGKPRELVVGKVPSLHAEEHAKHAKRGAFDLCFPRTRLEVFWLEKALGVANIVVDDVVLGATSPLGLVDQLAHLGRHRASEVVDAILITCSSFHVSPVYERDAAGISRNRSNSSAVRHQRSQDSLLVRRDRETES